jgi:hypothetical protein
MWDLALRTGALGSLGDEPNPGVRRARCAVLAGHGEGARVLDAARADPDPFVRGTAIQLAMRLAAGGALPVAAVLDAIAAEPALASSALGAIGDAAPAPLLAFARAQLDAPDRDTQLEAFEALVRAGAIDEARAWLVAQRDVDEPCRRWLRLRSPDSLATAFATAAPATRLRVLATIHAAPWRAAATLIGGDRELLADVVRERGDIAIPAVVLALAILDRLPGRFAHRLAHVLAAAGAGLAVLADVRRAVARSDTGGIRTLSARARAYVTAVEIGAIDVLDQLGELHPVEHLIGLEHALARWVDHGSAPADLLPLVPELRRHVEARLAQVVSAAADGLALAGGTQTVRLAGEHAGLRALLTELDKLRARPART